MGNHNKTRRARGGQITSPSGTPTSTKPRVNPVDVVNVLTSSLMRNPSNFSILSNVQSIMLRDMLSNPVVTQSMYKVLVNSLITILSDPGINGPLTSALVRLK